VLHLHCLTPSRLAFRQASNVADIEEKVTYEGAYWEWVKPIFGLEQGDPAIQIVESVHTRDGRLIVPNLLQH
jgi:hypothetical protein